MANKFLYIKYITANSVPIPAATMTWLKVGKNSCLNKFIKCNNPNKVPEVIELIHICLRSLFRRKRV